MPNDGASNRFADHRRMSRADTIWKRAYAAGACALALIIELYLAQNAAQAAPDFSRDVRPLFEQHCLKCHGPEKQKGGLRFDTKEGAFSLGESGEKAILPGHSSESRLIKLVSSKDE